MKDQEAKLEALKRLNQKMVALKSSALKGKPADAKQISILMMLRNKGEKK